MKYRAEPFALVFALTLCVACESEDSETLSHDASAPDGHVNGTSGDGGQTPQGFQVSGDTCGDIDFTKCGGDPTGTWSLADGCVTPTALPYYGACGGTSVEVTTTPNGSITLVDDGSFEPSGFFFDASLDARVPQGCLDEGETCADNPIDDEGTAEGELCQLNYGHDILLGSPGSYTTDAGAQTLEVGAESGLGGRRFEYCVEGDSLMLRLLDSSTHETILTLTRQ